MNKPITPEEMKAYVRSTWKKCQAEAWGDGKPVAIGWYIEGFSCVLGPIRPEVRYEEWRPSYALRKPPPQRTWVGLTPEEVDSLANLKVDGAYLSVPDTIRQTDAKLKEKNT